MANDENKQYENAAPIVKVVEALREVIDRDIDLGLYTPETLKKFRLTVEARREVVRQLSQEGKSTREIANQVGVSHVQVAKDLGYRPSESNQSLQKPLTKLTEEQIKQIKIETTNEMQIAWGVEKKALQDELKQQDQKIFDLQDIIKKQKGLQDRNDALESQVRSLKQGIFEPKPEPKPEPLSQMPPLILPSSTGAVAAIINALAEATKHMTHEQKIDVMVEACHTVGVAASQVYQRDRECREKSGW